MIPLFSGEVSAGLPFISDDSVDRVLDLHELVVIHPAATFFVRVKGDSMRDAHIHTGDILVVDRAVEPKNGTVVVALLDGQFTVKRLEKRSGRLFLRAENPAYPPIEVKEGCDFQVWGVVTYVIHKMNPSH